MTIEEDFFKCFGIKGEVNYTCPVDCGIEPPQMRFRCPDCEMNNTQTYIIYPEITDRILLELICINPLCVEFVRPKNVQELKFLIIDYYIKDLQSYANEDEAELFKHQVQSLFKGVGE